MCSIYLIECSLQNLGEGNIISVKIKPITSITSVVAIAKMRLPAPETEDLVLFWGKVLKHLFLRLRGRQSNKGSKRRRIPESEGVTQLPEKHSKKKYWKNLELPLNANIGYDTF